MTKPSSRTPRIAIASLDSLAHVTGGDKAPAPPPPKPDITYQKIESIWKDGNITSLDDWYKHNT